MLEAVKRYDIQVEGTRDQGDVKLVQNEVGDLVYYYEMRLHTDRMETEIKVLQRRLAEVGESELSLATKVIELEAKVRGPEGFDTWEEAAMSERIRRVKAGRELLELQQEYDKRDEEACELIERWLDVGQPHDWTGFQKRVEEFLGIDTPEPIPTGVHWRTEQGNFFNTRNTGQGKEFFDKWYRRRNEFPMRPDTMGRP